MEILIFFKYWHHFAGNMGRVLPEYLCKWTTKKVQEGNYFMSFLAKVFFFFCLERIILATRYDNAYFV